MVWGDRFLQQGREFAKDTLQEINPGGPMPVPPEKLDVGELRQKVMWKGKMFLIQGGWLFDPVTWKAVTI